MDGPDDGVGGEPGGISGGINRYVADVGVDQAQTGILLLMLTVGSLLLGVGVLYAYAPEPTGVCPDCPEQQVCWNSAYSVADDFVVYAGGTTNDSMKIVGLRVVFYAFNETYYGEMMDEYETEGWTTNAELVEYLGADDGKWFQDHSIAAELNVSNGDISGTRDALVVSGGEGMVYFEFAIGVAVDNGTDIVTGVFAHVDPTDSVSNFLNLLTRSEPRTCASTNTSASVERCTYYPGEDKLLSGVTIKRGGETLDLIIVPYEQSYYQMFENQIYPSFE